MLVRRVKAFATVDVSVLLIYMCVCIKKKAAFILNKVAKALGTIRFSQLLLLHLIHGAEKATGFPRRRLDRRS